MVIFPLQLTTSRIGNLNRLNHTLATITLSSEYVHAYTSFNTKMTRQARLHIYVPSPKGNSLHLLPRVETAPYSIYIYIYIYVCVPIRYLGTLFSIINKVQISIRNKVPTVYKVPELTSALIGTLKLICIQVHLVFCLCFGVSAWVSPRHYTVDPMY